MIESNYILFALNYIDRLVRRPKGFGPVFLSHAHTCNNVEATLSNATSRTILSTKSNVASTSLLFLATMLPVSATMSNEILSFPTKSKQIEHVKFVWTLSKGRNFLRHCCQNRQRCRSSIRLCRKDEILGRTRSTLLPFLATKSNVASTKSNVDSTSLLVWTGLYSRGAHTGPSTTVTHCWRHDWQTVTVGVHHHITPCTFLYYAHDSSPAFATVSCTTYRRIVQLYLSVKNRLAFVRSVSTTVRQVLIELAACFSCRLRMTFSVLN